MVKGRKDRVRCALRDETLWSEHSLDVNDSILFEYLSSLYTYARHVSPGVDARMTSARTIDNELLRHQRLRCHDFGASFRHRRHSTSAGTHVMLTSARKHRAEVTALHAMNIWTVVQSPLQLLWKPNHLPSSYITGSSNSHQSS